MRSINKIRGYKDDNIDFTEEENDSNKKYIIVILNFRRLCNVFLPSLHKYISMIISKHLLSFLSVNALNNHGLKKEWFW